MESKRFVIIIGAGKSGTTTLARWLGARSDMVLGYRKEPRFFTDFDQVPWTGPGAARFAETMISDEAEYLAAFDGPKQAKWCIDASTDYLWCPVSCERIAEWSRRFEVKLIAILRDPADRAFSQYQHTIRDHLETGTLEAALDAEETRYQSSWHPVFYHIRRSCYADEISRYAAAFGDSLMVMDYSDLSAPEACLERIAAFLGVPIENTAGDVRHNVSYSYRSQWLAKLLRKSMLGSMPKQIVPETLRHRLKEMLFNLVRKKARMSASDVGLLISRLAPEYARCAANPLIRMDTWPHAKAALAAQKG